MPPSSNKSKVKSGCRTCKARRVKCDEGWPVCFRCLSTGRVCEGYGIWGGGDNHFGRRPTGPDSSKCLKVFYAPTIIKAGNKEENQQLEWFTYRTAFKLPGVFRFPFWDLLVFQAASSEPAVLHAVLALGSAHRRESLPIRAVAMEDAPAEQEQFTLRNYSKAITHLQPHFSAKSNASIRVALIACLMFVMTEFLRGHYKSGITHLQNGLKVLDEHRARSSAIDSYSLFLEPCCNSVDAWIIQAFIRLDIQAKFLGHGSQHLNIILEDYMLDTLAPELTFQSIDQARQLLDRLFGQIFYLKYECRRLLRPQDQVYPSSILTRQRCIKARLASWYQTFKASRGGLLTKEATPTTIAYIILGAYYVVAEIMADTCLWPPDELKYDSHTQGFISIMEQLKHLRDLAGSPKLYNTLHFPDMSGSVADLGALPGLYYVAIKCRVHWIRHDALEFFNTVTHKEGIWNAPLAACIAREVVKIEEGDFYKGVSKDDEVSSSATPKDDEVSSSATPKDDGTLKETLPASYRLHDVQVELPEDYAGTAILRCKRKLDDHNEEVITREFVYDIGTHCWVGEDGGT
ncbi:hypothetical protein F4776DRAFT_435516 [Hypoxylon sp. NC0597]|nr:hypothetical protein F4776DRAFT_435516 [Hypoxylon sp. NC0597]